MLHNYFLLRKALPITLTCFLAVTFHANSQTKEPAAMAPEMTERWEPEPKVVKPGSATPNSALTDLSDAINLSSFQN